MVHVVRDNINLLWNYFNNKVSANISKKVVLTLIATADNKIFYYDGQLDDAIKQNDFSPHRLLLLLHS